MTGSIARAGSFKGPKLSVGVGTNVSTLTDALRKNGIYVEVAIVAPLAAAMPSEAETPAPAEDGGNTDGVKLSVNYIAHGQYYRQARTSLMTRFPLALGNGQ